MATVTLDKKYYIAKANEQFQDKPFNQKLNVDPTAKDSEIANSIYRKFQKARTIIKLDSKKTQCKDLS